MALPIEAALGFMPCASACFQNVVKSGGMGTPVKISTSAAWKGRNLAGEVRVQVLIAAWIDNLIPLRAHEAREGPAPGIAIAIVGEQAADFLVGIQLIPHACKHSHQILQDPRRSGRNS